MDKRLQKILEHFTGVALPQPIVLTIRYRSKAMRVVVDIGSLKVKSYALQFGKKKYIEENYECYVVQKGQFVEIIPKVFDEILRKNGFLSSFLEEHREKLREWFLTKGVKLLSDLPNIFS